MGIGNITVLIPIAESKTRGYSVSPRVNDLNGKVIGFLWNNKPNGDVFLQRVKELLSQRFQLSGTNWYRKAPEENLGAATFSNEIARSCDAVVNAVAD